MGLNLGPLFYNPLYRTRAQTSRSVEARVRDQTRDSLNSKP